MPDGITILCGDAVEQLRTLPDRSVHMCVTSPPFFGLRDYGVDRQIGLEATPAEWVAKLVDVFREVRRVLRDDGTCWIEIGDSYAATMTSDRRMYQPSGERGTPSTSRDPVATGQRTAVNGLKPKDLLGQPWMLAFALRDDGWWLRSEIIWARPNPMPESVTDRPTKAHSTVFLLAKQAHYSYDADGIREPAEYGFSPSTGADWREGTGSAAENPGRGSRTVSRGDGTGGRNARSVWTIPTQPLKDEHYAAFPEELARRCILAGTSEKGCCPGCGAPWERVTERTPLSTPTYSDARGYTVGGGARDTITRLGDGVSVTTTGWRPTCDHGLNPVPATVLDCFLGSGTTALVARKLGRYCVGIELKPEYVELAWRRLRDPRAMVRAQEQAGGHVQTMIGGDDE